MMFKDRNLNKRNDLDQKKNMKELVKAINDLSFNPNALKDLLLDGVIIKNQNHNPNHDSCTYSNSDSKRITEKRICRCMYYYNDIDASKELKERCAICNYPAKLKNDSPFKILDYEVPMKKVSKNVGGIDLVIQGIDGTVYGVEMKPPCGTETFVRMVSEILTYSELSDYEVEIKGTSYNFKPAICFFKKKSLASNSIIHSTQWRDYHKWLNDHDFETLINSVKVFYVTINGNYFDIHEMPRVY